MKRSELKTLIKEVLSEQPYGNDANFANSIVSDWENAFQTTKLYNIELTNGGKRVIFKLVDGGVVEITSSSPMTLSPIKHEN